jgi:uncharacterized damage-inducible protein DinB
MTAIWAQYALYNRLANKKLYEACAGLAEEERRRDLGAPKRGTARSTTWCWAIASG